MIIYFLILVVRHYMCCDFVQFDKQVGKDYNDYLCKPLVQALKYCRVHRRLKLIRYFIYINMFVDSLFEDYMLVNVDSV